MRKSCKKSKFTLIEMLAVIAIIAILLTVAIPGFMKAMQGDVNVRAGRTLSAALQKARAEAIINRNNAYLIFYPIDDSLPKQRIGVMVDENENVDWYELPKEVKLAYVSTDSCTDSSFSIPNRNPWTDLSDNQADFIKCENNRFLNADKNSDYLKEDKCKYITFAKDGRMTPYKNIYFVISEKETNDLDSAAKLEINKFTGEVKWLQ